VLEIQISKMGFKVFIWFSEVFLLQVGTPKKADCDNMTLLQYVKVYENRSLRPNQAIRPRPRV
jgi:hypothetical protein